MVAELAHRHHLSPEQIGALDYWWAGHIYLRGRDKHDNPIIRPKRRRPHPGPEQRFRASMKEAMDVADWQVTELWQEALAAGMPEHDQSPHSAARVMKLSDWKEPPLSQMLPRKG